MKKLFAFLVLFIVACSPQLKRTTDLSCPLWITQTHSTASPHYQLYDCSYLDETQSGGRTMIDVMVENADDSMRSGAPVVQK